VRRVDIVILLTWQNGRIKRVPKLGSPKLGEEPRLPDLVLLQTKYD